MDFFQNANGGIQYLPQFLTSLGIGLLIGLERERNPHAKAGLRTFALVALLGTLAEMLSSTVVSQWPLIAGWLMVGAMIIAAYASTPNQDNDPGTTTVAALLLCYGLGALVWHGETTLAIMLAVGITVLLYFKPELRGITQRLSRRDLVSILQFAVLTFIVLPILPDHNYGPYEALNPHNIWLMVVLISGLSLAGYVALRLIRIRYGVPLLGILGGMVSSTATSLAYARYSKSSAGMIKLSATVILIANMVVLLRLLALSAVAAPQVLLHLLPISIGGLLFGLAVLLLTWKRERPTSDLPVPETTNPTELQAALGFGLLYALVLLATAWLSTQSGSKGLYTVALVSGLTDVDAITLSSLHLLNMGKLDYHPVMTAIALAYVSNMVFKFGLVLFIGGKPLAKHTIIGFTAICVGVLVGLLFV